MPREITSKSRRRICFVTGTRAEFGLMRPVLNAIQKSRRLQLQIVVTGMHLDRDRGYSIDEIRKGGWKIDAVVPWASSTAWPGARRTSSRARRSISSGAQTSTASGTPSLASSSAQSLARATGLATAGLADAFASLDPDVVLVVGDRVEAFAAATAGHLSGRIVAHIHGGDRALGQVDDSLRHAITKLAHIHFPATAESARRIEQMGEDRWRIHRAGSPGVDGIVETAADRARIAQEFPELRPHRFAVILLHPVDADESVEFDRATMLCNAVARASIEKIVIIHPNNDPGSAGIIRAWEAINREPKKGDTQKGDNPLFRRGQKKGDNPLFGVSKFSRAIVVPHINRPMFLGLLRDAAMLVGNSSSGIIEATSFRTPVIDIGPRQQGRQRCADVVNVRYKAAEIRRAIAKIWNAGKPKRGRCANVYGGRGAGEKIAAVLESLKIDPKLLRKLIRY